MACSTSTTVAKTLVDCAPWLRGRRFEQAVDDARRRGLVTMEEVERSLAEVDHGRRTGRHLVVPVRPIAASRHHPGGSDRELDVLRFLRSAGLPVPVQQHRITVAGRVRYLDYAYPASRLYLEWDGFEDHGLRRAVFDDDRERDAELALAGWLGLHFTSRTRPRDIVRRVERALALRAPESVEIWEPNRR
jgi:very-short-patch-repair endonuclease